MSQPSQSVRDFVTDSYQIISAATPTVPLHGNDLSKGIALLNRLLNQYSATGLMITVSKKVEVIIGIGQGIITFASAAYIPDPIVPPYPIPTPIPPIFPNPPIPLVTTQGRLVNLENAWVTLDHVTYPLIDIARNEFMASYKFDTLLGLPRYIIVTPQTNITQVEVFPMPSQPYFLSVYGKFEVAE